MTRESNRRRLPSPTLWLARSLLRRRGGIPASEDILRLRSFMRFTGVYGVTVFGPALLLGYLGLADNLHGEAAVRANVDHEASSVLDSALGEVRNTFSRFETAALTRIASGWSLLEAPGELSPFLVLSVRLGPDGTVDAPFDFPDSAPRVDLDLFHDGHIAHHRTLAERDPARALSALRQASQGTRARGTRGAVKLHQARLLASTGAHREADAIFTEVTQSWHNTRDSVGFRLDDLARLGRATLAKEAGQPRGEDELKALVDEILNRRWAVGDGSGAAVARRALRLLHETEDIGWLSSRRRQIESQSGQLYWAERLRSEMELVTGGGRQLKVASGSFRYTGGAEALWATTWVDEQLYAFALQLSKIQAALLDVAHGSTRPDGQVSLTVLTPDEPPPEGLLARRSLAPWMPGWSVVAHPADPAQLAQEISSRRGRRLLLVVSSMLLVLLGAALTGRLVRREMDLARLKTSFAANVSHELRSPITRIRLKGEALQLGLVEEPEEMSQHYDTIVRETERLSRLVDNVLDFAAIERGTKNYIIRPADLSTTLRGAVEAMRHSLEARGMALEADLSEDLPVIPHDPDAIAQAVTNLLSNAAKYGAGGGWIGVTATTLPHGIEISVADRGIGIRTEEVDKVFDQFYRSADPQARRHKGTGIGLAIVKYIMDAHRGQVAVRSAPGSGSVFSLHIPFSTN